MRDKKIRILFIINSLAGGGAERVLSYILNSLSRKYFDISLIMFSEKRDYDLPKDIKCFVFNKRNRLDWFSIIQKLIKFLKFYQFDIVISFLTHVNIIVIISWLLSGKKSPLIVCERTNPNMHINYRNLKWFKKTLLTILYPLPAYIVSVSQGVKSTLISKFKIPPEKIWVIYNPLDIKKIDILKQKKVRHPWLSDDSTPIVLACGRLTLAKNYPLLIKAFKRLLDEKGIFFARLVILGEGKQKERLERLVRDLGLEKNVVFLGFQKNPYKYMNRATIFVLSSNYEGFPNVLLEAMACGVPVISTNCPYGPSEIIEHGKNGFLVPVDDEEKLADAMEKLLKDSKLREAFSREERKFVESKFKLEKIIKEWEKLIIETLSY